MQSPQAKLKEISRLLGSWPTAAAPVDGDEQLRSYMLAVEDYPADDVENAVNALIKGTAPGINPSFLPVPAVVGSECRRQMNLRLDKVNRERTLRPALPPPLIVHSAESRDKVKAMVEGLIAKTADAVTDGEQVRRKNDLWARTNARFMPDQSPQAVARRLGFSSGDPDGDEAA